MIISQLELLMDKYLDEGITTSIEVGSERSPLLTLDKEAQRSVFINFLGWLEDRSFECDHALKG